MKIRFTRRNFIFVLFSFVLMIFSCSAADAAYSGGVDQKIEDGECLTFTANQDGSWVKLYWKVADAVQYKKEGSTWQDYNKGNVISLNEDEYVRFRGTGVTTNYSNRFSMTGSISASGYVDSLRLKSLYNANYGQFQGLAGDCYSYMFRDCTSLISAPELPATFLPYGCYMSMFYGCFSLDLSTQEGDYVYSWTFKKGDTNMLPNGILSSAPVTNGYVTLYSKYPLSASLRTVLTKEGTNLTSDTDKASVKNGKLLSAMINISAPNNIIVGSGGQEAYITLKNADSNVASSKKFAVNVLNGKIVAENIDLFMNDQEGAAPDDAENTDIPPGVYDSCMTFVAA